MRLASYVLSLALHATLFLAIFFWPTQPLVKLDQAPVLISLVEGAPGGNRAPSPVQGPQGTTGSKIAPSMPAPQQKDVAPAVPDAIATPITQPKEEPKKPEPKPQPKPKEPEPQATPIAEKKEPPKPEPKKEEPKPEPKKEEPKKPEPKKEEPKKPEPPKPAVKKEDKQPAKSNVDPVKAALDKARAASSKENSPNRGSAVERALAEAKRNAGGYGGGGGGEGDGPGGGGLLDVYMGQVLMAVRANWQYTSASRTTLVCAVQVRVDATGKVLQARIEQSSGNALYDTTAVNAVMRTGASGQFPEPPGPEYQDLILTFNSNEMMGR